MSPRTDTISARAERQLILASAGTRMRREALREQALAVVGDVDWSRLLAGLGQRRLLGTLGPRILDLTGEQAPEGFSSAVDGALQAARRHGGFLALLTERVRFLLAQAGIRSTALKGPGLGEALYGDVGRRLSSDIDLLVTPEHLNDAVQVVRALGYRAAKDVTDGRGLPRLHFALQHDGDQLPPIELHWRIHWYEAAFAAERLLAPGAGPTGGGSRPEPADELAALLLFYARDGFVGLRNAVDVAAWWDRYGLELEVEAFNEVLVRYPLLARALRGAACAAEMVVGLPARQILGRSRVLSLRGRTAVRLLNPNPDSSVSQVYAEIGLIDGLLSPPGGMGAFLGRQLLPAREVLDQRANRTPEQQTRTWPAYVARLSIRCGVLLRYLLALVRIARGPETIRVDLLCTKAIGGGVTTTETSGCTPEALPR